MRFSHLIAHLGLFVLLATPAAPVLADPIVEGEEHCVVNVRTDDRLNVRRRPNAESAVVARWRYAKCGIIVEDSCRGNWCPAEDGHDAGWVHRHYLAAVSPALYCVTGVRRGDVLNLRAFPSPNSRIIAELHRRQCDIAFLPYAVGNWQKIRVEGEQGWVNRRYLSGE
jgi:SH3-like domain-containing protein